MSLEIHRKIRVAYGRKYEAVDRGNKDHSNMANSRLRKGAIRNGDILASIGFGCSFKKSLSASASGCGMPIMLTLFGPFRV